VTNISFGLFFKISKRSTEFFNCADDSFGKLVIACPCLLTIWIDSKSSFWFSSSAFNTLSLEDESKTADDVLRFTSIFFRSCSTPLADSLTRKSCCLLKASAVFLTMTFLLIAAIKSIPAMIIAVVVQMTIVEDSFFFIFAFQLKYNLY